MTIPETIPMQKTSRQKADQPRKAPERLAYRVDTLAEAYDVSRELIYRAIRNGELDARKWGGVTLITAESAKRFLGELPRMDSGDVKQWK